MASNNHTSNNQPRRKRNKKPVKRYSEEYNNRPNPYTGYSADGNYHPEAKKRPMSDVTSPRAKAAEEERIAAMNAAMTEAAWGPAPSAAQQAPQAQQPSRSKGYVPPTVTVPAPRWTVSNNLTRQQMAAQEQADQTPVETAVRQDNGGAPAQEQQSVAGGRGSHRRKNQRSKEEAARERAAKTEAKRAAVDKIAMGVAAHSVSEQMIDDISSMSDAIESMSKAPKKVASSENGVNWEEFYDAAFPPSSREPSKTASRKPKQPKKRIDFNEESSAEPTVTVKPVILGDDDLLPYDKITRENERAAAEAKAAKEAKAAEEERPVANTKAAQLAAEVKAEEKPVDIRADFLPEMEEHSDETPVLETVEETLKDISNVVNTVTIEDILAEVEKQKRESAQKFGNVNRGAEIAVGAGFSFDSDTDESWNEVIPSRSSDAAEENQPEDEPDETDSDSLLSTRLMLSYLEAEQQEAEQDDNPPELENIESVDINEFLRSTEPQQEPEPESEPVQSATIPAFEDDGETAGEFVPEIIVDSADLEEDTQEPEAEMPPEPEEAPEEPMAQDVPETQEEPEQQQEPETAEEQQEQAPEAAERTEETEASSVQAPVHVFIEEKAKEPEVEVIIADLEDEIFAEERLASPDGETEEETSDETGLNVEDKIEKLAEAAEVAEAFRQENDDLAPGEEQQLRPDAFSVSIDDVSVTPEVRSAEDEEIKEYQPREKTREPDENLFESVLIVDENPLLINKEASAAQDDSLYLHERESSENPTAVFKLPQGPIVFPTDIDDADFQEQWLDEDEDGDDMATRNKRTRRRISAFIGAVALLFAVMILFSAVKTVVSGFNNIGSTSEKKTEYTEFISPVVVNDPMPFESIEKADNNMLLQSSIWQALRELDETEGYEHVSDATNKIVLPAENVEKAAKELFGRNVQLNMNVLNEYDGSALYYYDNIYNTFHITRSGITGPSAVITKIAQKSDYISLVVGYVQQEEMSLTSSESTEVECYKFMEYVLALNSDGSYYIKSIRNYVEE